VLEVYRRSVGPQPGPNLVPRHDIAGLLEHHGEDLERLLLQPHERRAFAKLARAEIDLEIVETQDAPLHGCSRIAENSGQHQSQLALDRSGHPHVTCRSPWRH
jgi:hypothetical protein